MAISSSYYCAASRPEALCHMRAFARCKCRVNAFLSGDKGQLELLRTYSSSKSIDGSDGALVEPHENSGTFSAVVTNLTPSSSSSSSLGSGSSPGFGLGSAGSPGVWRRVDAGSTTAASLGVSAALGAPGPSLPVTVISFARSLARSSAGGVQFEGEAAAGVLLSLDPVIAEGQV